MVFIGGWRSGGPRRYRRPYGYPYRGGYGYGYGPRGGGSCLRDACLIESGCCLGEALAGNCLVPAVAVLPRFVSALVTGGPGGRRTSPAGAGAVRDRLVAAVRVYQETISPHLRPGTCRFTPSCSHYAVEALELHGAVRGSWLTVRRLLRCRPGGPRGLDTVPGRA
jgi:uncharacterized protein